MLLAKLTLSQTSVIQNAVSVAIGKNRLNAEIARAENAVRLTQKPFQCNRFVADRPHFESLLDIASNNKKMYLKYPKLLSSGLQKNKVSSKEQRGLDSL